MEKLQEKLGAEFRRLIREFFDSSLVDIPGKAISDDLKAFTAELEACILGGKLTRAVKFLHYAGVEFQDITQMHAYFCAGVEFFQTAMLIHDDIIDGDAVRRGRASSHETLGETEALLLGDFVLSAASWSFFKGVELSAPNIRAKLTDVWFKMHRDVLLGQVLDSRMVNQMPNELLHNSDALNQAANNSHAVVALKTASYTTIAPALLGAILGGDLDEKTAQEITQRELKLGVQFQEANDTKDLEKDLKTGKLSALIIKILAQNTQNAENNTENQNKVVKIIAKSKNANADELKLLREIVERKN